MSVGEGTDASLAVESARKPKARVVGKMGRHQVQERKEDVHPDRAQLTSEGKAGALRMGRDLPEEFKAADHIGVWATALPRSGETYLTAAEAAKGGDDAKVLERVEGWRQAEGEVMNWGADESGSMPHYTETDYLSWRTGKKLVKGDKLGESRETNEDTPYAKAVKEAVAKKQGLRWMVEQSDALAVDPENGADPSARSFSTYAGVGAGILLHQARSLYPNLTEVAQKDKKDMTAARLVGSHAMITECLLIAAARRVAERDGGDPNQAAEDILRGIEARNKDGMFKPGETIDYEITGDPQSPEIVIRYEGLELRLTVADLEAIYIQGYAQADGIVDRNAGQLPQQAEYEAESSRHDFSPAGKEASRKALQALDKAKSEAHGRLIWKTSLIPPERFYDMLNSELAKKGLPTYLDADGI